MRPQSDKLLQICELLGENTLKTIWFWVSVFLTSLVIFIGLCWLDIRPDPTLHRVAADGNLKQIKKQLAAGTDINALDEKGLSPLLESELKDG